MTRRQWLDLAERVGATAAEAGIGVAVTQLSGVPAWWAVAAVPVLSAVKSWLLTRVTGTASLLRPTAVAPVAAVPPIPAAGQPPSAPGA